MGRLCQPRFDPKALVEARRAFRFNGKDFKPGQPFQVTDKNARRARKMYEGRFLCRSENREQVVFTQPSGLRVVRRSTGWYDVMGPGDKVLNPAAMRKEAAEAFAAGYTPPEAGPAPEAPAP